jgi:membrane-bound lytic murein transglycosylase D
MGSTDFWQLTRSPLLADETKNFVASIQAISLIGRAPDRYGFTVTPADPLRYETVQVPAGTSLKRLAAQSGVEETVLAGLNTELRLGQTPPGKPYAMKVPVGTSPKVHVALGRDPAHMQVATSRAAPGRERVARAPSRAYHVVKPQETVGSIAKRYGVSPLEIARWNRLAEADRIRPGDRLRVASLTRAEREDGQGGFR